MCWRPTNLGWSQALLSQLVDLLFDIIRSKFQPLQIFNVSKIRLQKLILIRHPSSSIKQNWLHRTILNEYIKEFWPMWKLIIPKMFYGRIPRLLMVYYVTSRWCYAGTIKKCLVAEFTASTVTQKANREFLAKTCLPASKMVPNSSLY